MFILNNLNPQKWKPSPCHHAVTIMRWKKWKNDFKKKKYFFIKNNNNKLKKEILIPFVVLIRRRRGGVLKSA